MDKQQKLTLIENWIAEATAVNDMYEKLREVTGLAPDSALGERLYETLDAYTDTLSLLLEDDFKFLYWYLWDNDLGKKGLSAKASSWKKERKITTAKVLLALIEGTS